MDDLQLEALLLKHLAQEVALDENLEQTLHPLHQLIIPRLLPLQQRIVTLLHLHRLHHRLHTTQLVRLVLLQIKLQCVLVVRPQLP
jgi:hypothetical protein